METGIVDSYTMLTYDPYRPVIGPLPMDAVMELLYRVKTFTVGGFGYYGEDYDSFSVGHEMRRELPSTERGNIEVIDNIGEDLAATPLLFSQYFGGSAAGRLEFVTYADSKPISVDENGDFWLRLGLGLFGDSWLFFGNQDSGGLPVSADLVLSRRTYPLKVVGYQSGAYDYALDSGELTITASEWFPYATKGELPAWDTSTGLPTNGGPGA